jgi:hypothetical protein
MTNTRNMTAPRRCETQWEQTIQIDRRRAPRTRDNPYRRRQRNSSGTHPTDWIVLGMFLATCVWLWWGPLAAWWAAL